MKMILFLLCLFIYGCDYLDERLKIVNSSDKNIFSIDAIDTFISIPDCNHKNFYLKRFIKSHDTLIDSRKGNNAWSFFIKNTTKNNKLNLFIFYLDTLKKYNNIDSIIIKNRYAKRYILSEEELNKMNWTITFDGK